MTKSVFRAHICPLKKSNFKKKCFEGNKCNFYIEIDYLILFKYLRKHILIKIKVTS